jgi:hypothetical protein
LRVGALGVRQNSELKEVRAARYTLDDISSTFFKELSMHESQIVAVPSVPGRPEPGAFFRHVDGGYYQYLMTVRHSDDQASLVLYRHMWPFEQGGDPWVRPQAEWDKRFMPVSAMELQNVIQTDQAQAQQAVHEAKAARRAAGG